MDKLPSNSDFRRSLNSSRGRSRRAAARLTRGASSASAEGSSESGRESSACTASSSCWNRERLGMGPPHLTPQALQGAKLQLLDGAFAAAQLVGDLANAFLLHKAQNHYPPLVGRQLANQLKEGGALFHLAQGNGIGDLLHGQLGLAAGLLPPV